MLVTVLVAAVGTPLAFAEATAVQTGTDGNDVIVGTDGSEALYGGAGNDTISGGGGNDELDGGAGADVLNGGTGSDVVSYSGGTAVKVSLNGIADDGSAGEGDNVGADVEDIFGGDGDDKLTGNGSANTIDGGAGDDTIDGGGGTDSLFGGDGDDTITSRDGKPDRVDCGPGHDSAIVDAVDTVTGCERQALPAVTPPLRLSKLFPNETRTGVGSLLVAGVLKGSTVVVACRSGCSPARSPRTAILRARQVHPREGGVKLTLGNSAGLVAGTMFEIGVTAPRAKSRCDVFKLSDPPAKVTLVHVKCTTVAAAG